MNRTKRNGLLVVGCLLLAGLVLLPMGGCKKSKGDPMPASGVVTGWDKSGDTKSYAAADLWQYMDGGADQYVQAGVVTTKTADYKYQGQLEATVEVHTFGDATAARKLFDSTTAAGGKSVSLGDVGLSYVQSAVFCKGKSMVRIVAYEASPTGQDALVALAKGVESRL